MSKTTKKLLVSSVNEYVDRRLDENENIPQLTVNLESIKSMLLLLDSEEEIALIAVLRHLTEYLRKSDENVATLKKHQLWELMLHKEFYRDSSHAIVRRFSLYLMANMVESMNILQDMKTEKTLQIIDVCLQYYEREDDNFCLEYLTVIINKCLQDPQVALRVLNHMNFTKKFTRTIASSNNPDEILNSLQILEQILKVKCVKELEEFISQPYFPELRILCELTSEFENIRRAALKVTKLLVLDMSQTNPLRMEPRMSYLWEQLTTLFCDTSENTGTELVASVMAAALRNEAMAHLFFEQNHFARLLDVVSTLHLPDVCPALLVFSEAASYEKFIPRLADSAVVEQLLSCLLADYVKGPTGCQYLQGLNRMMKSCQAANKIVDAYERGVINKLLDLVKNQSLDVKIREQSTDLLLNLLKFSFYKTGVALMFKSVKFSEILSTVFEEGVSSQSTDLLFSLLSVVEELASNDDYRQELCEDHKLIENMGMLLMNSFSTAILVGNIFRCLCLLVDEASARYALLQTYIIPSIKRALKSLSNLVKASVTNFVIQTTRFPEFLNEYLDQGVLEVLILQQKHAFCVPTWNTAIESILSKTPTMKFCIRNHLGFTDLTTGHDFFVSKKKFNDFRTFQANLKNDVSPLDPVLVVNFERSITPEESIIKIPIDCFVPEECQVASNTEEWCYCRTPGDAYLPMYLKEVYNQLDASGLTRNSEQSQNSIDFENINRRVKIIARVVAKALANDLQSYDLNSSEECSQHIVKCHLKALAKELHCSFIPLGLVRSGCHFERAVLFKALADQVGLPCTLQRSVDGRVLFNEVPMPLEMALDVHCDPNTMKYMPWRMLRPTHIVDLMHNVGELHPLQSRQALQYLRLY
ncbi:uncharacterized protein LOC106087588 [Stomoxys calcitrans]|uniref:uncharacterized protein LOC106087588 n=1 Tax=Stomoxys calcitrans TaxID=35570 RepID=UPI0027E265EE|nr:uncharacterized protein LOC106087588 [Stomoxys calcitrans]